MLSSEDGAKPTDKPTLNDIRDQFLAENPGATLCEALQYANSVLYGKQPADTPPQISDAPEDNRGEFAKLNEQDNSLTGLNGKQPDSQAREKARPAAVADEIPANSREIKPKVAESEPNALVEEPEQAESVLEFTRFAGVADTTGEPVEATWRELVIDLAEYDRRESKAGQLISAFRFAGKRCNANALRAAFVMLDFDHIPEARTGEILAAFKEICAHCVYSSFRHGVEDDGVTPNPDQNRFRVVLLLSHSVKPDEYGHLCRLLQEQFPEVDPLFDPQHPFYTPSAPEGREVFAYAHEGEPLDVDALLAGWVPPAKAVTEAPAVHSGNEPDAPEAQLTACAEALAKHESTRTGGDDGAVTTYGAAQLCKMHGLSRAQALLALHKHYNPRCQPPWLVSELQRKVRMAYDSSEGPPFDCIRKEDRAAEIGAHLFERAAETARAAPEPVSSDTFKKRLKSADRNGRDPLVGWLQQLGKADSNFAAVRDSGVKPLELARKLAEIFPIERAEDLFEHIHAHGYLDLPRPLGNCPNDAHFLQTIKDEQARLAAAGAERAAKKAAASQLGAAANRFLKTADGTYYIGVNYNDSAFEDYAEASPKLLQPRVRELCNSAFNSGNESFDAKCIDAVAASVGKVIMRYSQPQTTFEASAHAEQGGKLIKGLRVDSELTAKRDAAVEAWLTALCGDNIERAQQWIAATAQEHLDSPSQQIDIIGPPSIGKTLIAHGVARIYGCTAVDGKNLGATFNSQLGGCPIVLIDEKMPDNLTDAKWRDLTGGHSIELECKFKDISTIEGCLRIVGAFQSKEKARFASAKTTTDVDAIAKRLIVINVEAERESEINALLQPLIVKGGKADLVRIAQHFMWLQQTVTVHTNDNRFVGPATFDPAARELVQGGEHDHNYEFIELLREACDRRTAWEHDMSTGSEVAYGCNRARHPVRFENGGLLVYPASIASLLGIRSGQGRGTVQDVLSAFVVDTEGDRNAVRKVTTSADGRETKNVKFWRLSNRRLPADLRQAIRGAGRPELDPNEIAKFLYRYKDDYLDELRAEMQCAEIERGPFADEMRA